jgi:preprotein translocase subunit SecG
MGGAMNTVFTVLHLVVTLLLIFIVLAQEGKDPGMKGISGPTSDSGDSFFSKNTGKTKQALLTKLTTCVAILFLITTMVLVILAA